MNPFDPDAKIGRTKDGATDMIYKPEVVVDLDTGAIVQASVNPGDQADHQDLAGRVLEAQQTINAAREESPETLTIETATADKGYYMVAELEALQKEQVKTVISDPIDNRRVDKLPPEQREVVRAARRAVKSKRGKKLLARRGMHIERTFAHILDCGGARRTTLRGQENLNKRYKLAAAVYNLSQLMRKLFGFGTSKQLEALWRGLFLLFWKVWRTAVLRIGGPSTSCNMPPDSRQHCGYFREAMRFRKISVFSTGCYGLSGAAATVPFFNMWNGCSRQIGNSSNFFNCLVNHC
jgi:hypothetical protein